MAHALSCAARRSSRPNGAVEFSRRFFGFDGRSEWQGETFVIRNGEGFTLALTPSDSPPPWPPERHVRFLLESVEEARRLRARVESAGHRIVETYEQPEFGVFKVRDPDAYVVEVEAGVPVLPPP